MKILVTGANGQLGSEIQPLLEPHEVIGVDLPELDITDRALVLAAFHDIRPDVVINCAAMTAVDDCESKVDLAYSVNALAVRHLAEGCRAVGAHLTTVSTDYVFDGTKIGPYNEWDATSPASVYGRSKVAGELEAGLSSTIVRTAWLCGEFGPNMVKTILRLLGEHDTLTFVDDQIGHPTFTTDLAPVLRDLAISRRPGVFHVTNQGAVSWHQFAQEVAKAAGADPARISPCSTADFGATYPAPRPANSVLDNMAMRLSGLPETRDFREPLAELVSRLV
ncbi:MAG: dTDP-4-dehydrorhamnose reductase [Candidatus Aldehydirespiratoraceae bacterium]|jgi:dTDP-4-dehydrorhamnose reductase